MNLTKLEMQRQRIKSHAILTKICDWLEHNEHKSHLSEYRRQKENLIKEKAILRLNGGNYYN